MSNQAVAQCLPDSGINHGDTISCNGTDADGFESGKRDLDITVNTGAVVNGDDGIDSGGDLSVTNHGLIQAGGKGIQAQDEFGDEQKVTVVNTGTITAFDEAIEGGDNSEVTNSGTITSLVEDAVNLGENALIINGSTGVIESLGGAQDAIDIDPGTIDNEAPSPRRRMRRSTMTVLPSTAMSSNQGGPIIALTVGIQFEKADGPNTAAQIMENSGLIEGGLLSLDLCAGEDMYTHLAGGELVGGAKFGGDNDTLIFQDMLDGISGWLDGGLGLDTMIFETYDASDVIAVKVGGQGSTLFFGDDIVRARSWEVFQFSGGSCSLTDFQSVTTVVPLPAGVWGLLTALGLLGWVRRDRAI